VIPVGRLLRTRGRSGEFIAEIYSSQPGRADRLSEVVLDLGGRQAPVHVERLWYHDGRPVFKFAGIDSISQAELWEHAEILVPEAQRLVPDEGEYLHEDLIGCTVQAQGNTIGVVQSIEEYGSAPLLRVTAADGREMLIPFARAICREIDVLNKIIRAEIPEGLENL
jgi:16S rRNA processing protein RimM